MRRTAAATLALALAATGVTAAVTVAHSASPGTSTAAAAATVTSAGTLAGAVEGASEPRDVMFVGNNWEGTATVVNPRTYRPIKTLDMVPDKDERMLEIMSNPDKLAFYLAIRAGVGEGNDQFTDDMFTTHDGRLLAVSRPSFADVVGLDLETGEIVWRFPMEGYRADHMGVSPNGRRLLVSDSTANKVHELNIFTGRKTREFASGDTPHENNYTADGGRIFHASIGRVYTPVDRSEFGQARDTAKGERVFQIVRNRDMKITQRWDMGKELAEAGYPGMSSAVRPMAVAPDERFVYLQVSFFHGIVEFDTRASDPRRTYEGEPLRGKVRRVIPLPDRTDGLPREQYVLDSAHHGLAMNRAGTKLCAAGTMSDYAAIVDRRTTRRTIRHIGPKPYWSTNSPVRNECWLSVSGDDKVVVINYKTAKKVATIPVGDHPQRVREGFVDPAILTAWRS